MLEFIDTHSSAACKSNNVTSLALYFPLRSPYSTMMSRSSSVPANTRSDVIQQTQFTGSLSLFWNPYWRQTVSETLSRRNRPGPTTTTTAGSVGFAATCRQIYFHLIVRTKFIGIKVVHTVSKYESLSHVISLD